MIIIMHEERVIQMIEQLALCNLTSDLRLRGD